MVNLSDHSEQPRAILVGLNTNQSAEQYAASMHELTELARSLDLEVADQVVQNTPAETRKTHIGSEKVLELKAEVEMLDADIVLFNETLTPMQMKNLEDILDTEVLDRTGVILQIFSRRARTREARLQVRSVQYLII